MMTELKPYDPGDLIRTEEDIHAYLTEALNDEDPAVFIIALGDVARMKGLDAVAKKVGIAPETLLPLLSGRSTPSWDAIHRLMQALDIHLRAVA
jgi:probable addiction module antidote protein